jgi:cell division protein FtsW (lipid II flippase)
VNIERRLFTLTAVFLGVYSLALTLAPAARARSWEVEYRWLHWVGFILWLAAFTFAYHQSRRHLIEHDPYLLPIAALLSGWGMLTIWRLFPSFGLRQTFWLTASMGLLILGLRLPSRLDFLRQYKYVWLTGGLILTGLTLLLGTNPTGSPQPRLWLGCCGIYLQPSEPLKLLLIVYLAAYFADRQPHPLASPSRPSTLPLPSSLTASPSRLSVPLLPLLAPTLLLTGVVLLLLLVQRDLGTASIFIFLYSTIVFLAIGRKLILVVGGLTLGVSGIAAYLLFDVVRLRVDAWLNPWLDPSGRSYQIVQSLIAVANGGIGGRGPGLGNPGLVPVAHSDFIFAALAEETGLVGVIALVILLMLLTARGLRIAIGATDAFRRYLAGGLTAYLIGQSILISGGNLRLLPLTGVTLPFVSYGGSSLVTSFLALLILLHISQRSEEIDIAFFDVRPYRMVGGFLLCGLAAVGLTAGWWAYYRGPALLERTDNARRSIAERFVQRGSLLDRDDEPLAISAGLPGELLRRTLYPELGAVIGYDHPIYGLSGLEDGLDSYLRGLQGNPPLLIWWNHLLYGQPPPGLDVRLSLDLDYQRVADELLGNRPAALVLLNAQSGEILALASHPTYDPNTLDQTWQELIRDPRLPLFNRASLGLYLPGTASGPFFLAANYVSGDLPPLPAQGEPTLGNQLGECALPSLAADWGAGVSAGCPAIQFALANRLGEQRVLQLIEELGWYSLPALPLEADYTPRPAAFSDSRAAYLGQGEIRVSPLQMALAAAALSNGGVRPAPRLAVAVNPSPEGWVALPPPARSVPVFSKEAAQRTVAALASVPLPLWQSVGLAYNDGQKSVTWYLSGTLPIWNGAPLALAVLLEEANPPLAQRIGQAMWEAILYP